MWGRDTVTQQQATAVQNLAQATFADYFIQLLPDIIFIAWTLYLVRKAKRAEICDLWDKKLN